MNSNLNLKFHLKKLANNTPTISKHTFEILTSKQYFITKNLKIPQQRCEYQCRRKQFKQ